jgi:transposase
MISIASESPYFAILNSIKGISKILAAQFIAECPKIENFKYSNQLQKYIGFSLRTHQSGNYAGARHINKLGNKRLARVFFQMLEQTSRYIPEVRLKYLTRKTKCKNYRKNIIAISDKLAKLIIGLFNQNKLYQNNIDENLKIKLEKLEKKFNKKKKK